MMQGIQITADGWPQESLTYCSNVHAGESLDDILCNLKQFNRAIRQRRGLKQMTSGLWLSALAADSLRDPDRLRHFKDSLITSGTTLTSINGFPYGNFHDAQLKEKVYQPDWSEMSRLHYTKNLADILAACLPEDVNVGAISTLPLGYKQQWDTDKHAAANSNIQSILHHLAALHEKTGKKILLCIEMEPDCVLESSGQLIQYFQNEVQQVMQHAEFLGICFDVCHQAVMHEDITRSLNMILAADITIGKIQLSNALQADLNTPERERTRRYLHEFSEPVYLHQVKTIDEHKRLHSSPDLTLALDEASNTPIPETNPWRIHFHVPLNTETLLHPSLTTTRQALHHVFDFLKKKPDIRPYLEVETYSWHVLPAGLRPVDDTQLIRGIASELDWVAEQLEKRNLLLADTDNNVI